MNTPVPLVDTAAPGFALRAREALLRWRRSDGRGVDEADVPRFTETLRLIGSIFPVPQSVCDVATFGGLEPVLVELFGVKEIVTTGSPESPGGDHLTFRSGSDGGAHQFQHLRFNIEDRFPLPDSAFDLVIFTEVLEHLSRDPMHPITRTDGWLLLTTPNSVCLGSVLKAVRGDHPYNWSPYSAAGNRDRHNREYTPGEVIDLVSAAGYEVVSCTCTEVYDKQLSPLRRLAKKALAQVLSALRRVLGGRDRAGWIGETIFLLARKTGPVVERRPEWLYYGFEDKD
jgi:hypothetical protein